MDALMYTLAALLYLWAGSSATKHIVRMRNDPTRMILLTVAFPAHFVVYPASYIVYCWEEREMPVSLLTATFWLLPIAIFSCGLEGFFVPEDGK